MAAANFIWLHFLNNWSFFQISTSKPITIIFLLGACLSRLFGTQHTQYFSELIVMAFNRSKAGLLFRYKGAGRLPNLRLINHLGWLFFQNYLWNQTNLRSHRREILDNWLLTLIVCSLELPYTTNGVADMWNGVICSSWWETAGQRRRIPRYFDVLGNNLKSTPMFN